MSKYADVWLRVYEAVASSFNSKGEDARRWADRALEEFRQRDCDGLFAESGENAS